MDEEILERTSALFASMGHPTRLQIVNLLGDQQLSVGDISAALHLPQSSTSQHLAALLRSGVLKVKSVGTTRLYQVRGPRIHAILKLIIEFCDVQGLKGAPAEEEPR